MIDYNDLKSKAMEEVSPVQKLINLALKNNGEAIIKFVHTETYNEREEDIKPYLDGSGFEMVVNIQFDKVVYIAGVYDLLEEKFTAQTILKDMIDWTREKAEYDLFIGEKAGQLADYLEDFYNKYIKEKK